MPELPEVETIRRTLEPRLRGRALESVFIRETRLRYPVDRRHFRGLPRQRFLGVRRRAKYLLFDLDGGSTLLVHLGMSGRLVLCDRDAAREPHEHVVFAVESERELRYVDPRRFGFVDAMPTVEAESHRLLASLGVEPLSSACTGHHLHARSRGRRASIKSFVMDSRIVTGVGNIYANEALFRAGIHPGRAAGRISRSRYDRLAEVIREVLSEAIAAGGTTIADFRDGTGARGGFQFRLQVWGRDGAACTACGQPVRRRTDAQRSTWYCPRCQR